MCVNVTMFFCNSWRVVGKGGGEFSWLVCRSLEMTEMTDGQSVIRSGDLLWGAEMVQWWEHSLPTNVARVRLLGPSVICGLSLLLVLVFARRGFSPGTPVFPFPQKPAFPNSNSIRNPRATGLSVPDCCVSPSLNKVDFFLSTISYGGGNGSGLVSLLSHNAMLASCLYDYTHDNEFHWLWKICL